MSTTRRSTRSKIISKDEEKSQPPRRSARFRNCSKIINYSESRWSTDCDMVQIDKSNDVTNFEMQQFKDELNNIEQSIEEPTELFSNSDVDGKDMYRVNANPIKKDAMIEKAKMTRNSQSGPDSPIKKDLRICLTKVKTDNKSDKLWNIKSNSAVNNNRPNLRKHKLTKSREYFTISSSDKDTSSEMSEDENSQNSTNEDENYESSSSEDKKKSRKNKNIPEKKVEKKVEKNVEKNVIENNVIENNIPRRSLRPRVNKAFHLQTDEYFTIQSEKSVTSNHTLSRLKNEKIDEEKLQKLLANNSYISTEHQEKINSITKTLETFYTEWLHIMKEGFTVLLYGLGSKRLLINNFRKQVIPDEPALVINGFFPSLTIKEILDSIITDLLGLESETNPSECFDLIEETMKAHKKESIYLLIHNLDGGMLRPNKVQDMLSRLATIPNVHILASIDHINAPLLWDNVKRSRYNFYWIETSTFLPYEAETSYESSLLVQKSGALALLSLENVFASLTSNAKSIYKVLVKYQIKNTGSHYPGMAFKDLYRVSREEFLVSSDQALRAQLTEFIDHKLVKIKRQVDGVEYLLIPLDNALLNEFLEQQNEVD